MKHLKVALYLCAILSCTGSLSAQLSSKTGDIEFGISSNFNRNYVNFNYYLNPKSALSLNSSGIAFSKDLVAGNLDLWWKNYYQPKSLGKLSIVYGPEIRYAGNQASPESIYRGVNGQSLGLGLGLGIRYDLNKKFAIELTAHPSYNVVNSYNINFKKAKFQNQFRLGLIYKF